MLKYSSRLCVEAAEATQLAALRTILEFDKVATTAFRPSLLRYPLYRPPAPQPPTLPNRTETPLKTNCCQNFTSTQFL